VNSIFIIGELSAMISGAVLLRHCQLTSHALFLARTLQEYSSSAGPFHMAASDQILCAEAKQSLAGKTVKHREH